MLLVRGWGKRGGREEEERGLLSPRQRGPSTPDAFSLHGQQDPEKCGLSRSHRCPHRCVRPELGTRLALGLTDVVLWAPSVAGFGKEDVTQGLEF